MADKNKAKFMPSFFHVGPEQIEAAKKLTEADFQLADEEEKESVIQRRKSVSYWRDAFRRFRENTVSMVALFVFFIIVLFTFLDLCSYPMTTPVSTGRRPNCHRWIIRKMKRRSTVS